MQSTSERLLAFLLPLAVIVIMLAVATLTGRRDLIFPEGAALTFGIVVVRNPEWSVSRWRTVLMPTTAAVVGHLLSGLSESAWCGEIIGVTTALLLLQAFGSRLAPALSAAVLPVVFGVRSWAYPAVVLVICLLIVAIVSFGPRGPGDAGPVAPRQRWPWDVALGGWVLICAWILAAGPLLSLPVAAVAPPLFVSAFQWFTHGAMRRIDGLRRCGLLVGAALAGSLAARIAPDALTAGLAGLAATLALMRLLGTLHPPALAISLIPLIAGAPNPWHFTSSIAIGAAALYTGCVGVASTRTAVRSRRRPRS